MNCWVDRDKTVSEQGPLAVPAAHAEAPTDRRLHPLSWLFVLLTQLRSMVFPLVAFVIFGRGDSWVFYGLIGAFVFALYALIYSLSFRYRIGERELLVRSGIFSRTERHVPYARIQNIVQKRNLLHRLFKVTELRLESAGGSKPEAVMNVITLTAAAELERVLKRRGGEAQVEAEQDINEVTPWHALEVGDLLRLGLINDRGWVAVGALVAILWQQPGGYNWKSKSGANDWNPTRELYSLVEQQFGTWSNALSGWVTKGFSLLALGLLIVVLIKLLSMVMAVLSFYRFRLSGDDTRLSTETGLLTRHVASARRDKIQRLIIGESWLARRLGRRWLSCEVAAGAQVEADAEHKALRLRWLAPVGTSAQIESIVARVMPGVDFANLQWKALHPRAWLRMFKTSVFWWSLLLLPASILVSVWVLLPGAAIVLWAWRHARGWSRFAGYACDGEFIAYRAGWWHRQWVIARIDKGQTVSISHSPFDRRRGMHTVSVDTAGAALNSFALSVPYLPIDEARALAEVLRARMSVEPDPVSSHG